MLEALIHGIVLAFGLIIPLGVQNVFVFNQGATQPSLWWALPAVIMASVCDTLLILLAVLGVSVIVFTFAWIKMILFTIGFFFLLYMGWVIWKSEPSSQNGSGQLSAKQQIAFAASVSLLNPHAILDTIGVIGTSSLHYTDEAKWIFTFACIIVSWLWFLGLAIAGRVVGHMDPEGRWLRRINKLSALIIWGVAVYLGIELTTSL
ncbi:LysE/ArgO family amino acid transporter [Paenactinomyces guangxiensis]|uniref:Amino acid transporter n=1 Tax=Paenactinomyces guangxiensis TaxID=1490290 RepID=A0A7W1WMM8_9BACL|nr:LysE/ArgO family amino acid transporter [Paenactinomyces guangxiensis]MBA4492732.1 amino acid transporter [Paenactinomyces guangxiensis]MBH8590419.1 amino acid transporter [Paenactinomyces guangxiensis]